MILLALCGQAVSAQQIPGFEFDHFEFPGGEFFGEASCRVIGDADSSDINSFPKLFMTSCPPGFRAETFISSLGVPAELPGGTQEGFLVVLDAPVTLGEYVFHGCGTWSGEFRVDNLAPERPTAGNGSWLPEYDYDSHDHGIHDPLPS